MGFRNEHDGGTRPRAAPDACCTKRCASPASSSAAIARSRCAIPTSAAWSATVPKATVSTMCGSAFALAKPFKSKLTRYDRYTICYRAAELIAVAHRRDLRPHHRRVGPVQEGFTVRGRPRVRRVRVRRQRGAQRRRPGFLVRPDAARQAAQGLYAARTVARRHLRDHAVQSSAQPGRAQDRTVDRHQQSHGAEAEREDAAHRAAAGRHPVRSRLAAGNALGDHR